MIPKLIAIAKKPKVNKQVDHLEEEDCATQEISPAELDYMMRITPNNKILN